MANRQEAPGQLDQVGIYILPGRISDPQRGVREAVEAERLGFRRVWLSERYDVKDGGVLCGVVAARTTSIGVAAGVLADAVRHPLMTAALAATMQATFPGRFLLGLGRGHGGVLAPQGFHQSTLQGFTEYVELLKRLWAGEVVSYQGILGTFPSMTMVDKLVGPPPELVYGTFAKPAGVELAAKHFDGVLLLPYLSVAAVRDVATRLRDAVERAGRDPDRFRIYHGVVTAPDFDEDRELMVVHARAITNFQAAGVGEFLASSNGWSLESLADLRAHPLFTRMRTKVADQQFTRTELLDVAKLVPRQWMEQSAAVGSSKECCERLGEYLDAGVDELVIHGSSPADNAELLRIWRERQSKAKA